jgi:hypothetical protein
LENGHHNLRKKKPNKRKHQARGKEDVESITLRKEGTVIHR